MQNFLVTADTTQVHVYCNYPTYTALSLIPTNDLFPTGFFVSTPFVPADYGIKVYAMAPNPEYIEP